MPNQFAGFFESPSPRSEKNDPRNASSYLEKEIMLKNKRTENTSRRMPRIFFFFSFVNEKKPSSSCFTDCDLVCLLIAILNKNGVQLIVNKYRLLKRFQNTGSQIGYCCRSVNPAAEFYVFIKIIFYQNFTMLSLFHHR